MKIINPSVEIMNIENGPQKHIESIARTCYKSNDLITEDSHKRFIKSLVDRKHWAMLEHFIFIYEIPYPNNFYNSEILPFMSANVINLNLKYFRFTQTPIGTDKARFLISFSARSILDAIEYINNKKVALKDDDKYKWHIDFLSNFFEQLVGQILIDYSSEEIFSGINTSENKIGFKKVTLDELNSYTDEEILAHGWKSVKFICDRGVSHEIVRHRDASFAQESTRYCNYSKDKHSNELTIIEPLFYEKDSINYKFWLECMQKAEDNYIYLTDNGSTAQEARSVLPNSLKTEIIMTARNHEWCHFFGLRCDIAAHPQMRQVAIPLYRKFISDNNLYERYTPNKDSFQLEKGIPGESNE